MNFILAHNTRSKFCQAFKSSSVKNLNKTFDLKGCALSFFKRWIIHELYGNMIFEIFGSLWQIDHCLPIASFNVLDENDMKKKCFIWVNLRPVYSNENNSKKAKIDYRLYLFQHSKAKYFLKLDDQERHNQEFHR